MKNLKHIIAALCIAGLSIIGIASYAQNTCSSAVSISPSTTAPTTEYQFNDSIMYFTFVADSVNTEILILPPSDTSYTKAHFNSMTLYSGTCSSLTLLSTSSVNPTNDTLPSIGLDNLTIGTTYTIKVSNGTCGSCPSNGYFRIQVKDLILYPLWSSGSQCNIDKCGINLVNHGCFEQGSMGTATSDMTDFLNTTTGPWPASDDLYDSNGSEENAYAISHNTNSSVWNVGWLEQNSPCGENYMIINSPDVPKYIWKESVNVTQNTKYFFSAWFINLVNANNHNCLNSNATPYYEPPVIELDINGNPLALPVTIPCNTNGTWVQVCFDWNSSNTCTAILQIKMLSTALMGDDLGLTGIEFHQKDVTPITFTIVHDISCHGAHDGSITANPGCATSYHWSNGATTQTISGLSSGTYTVTVVESGCTATASITLSDPPILTVLLSHTDILCFGTPPGTITPNVAGGTSGYSFNWNGPGGFQASYPNLSGLNAGIYYVTVTDAHGCTATSSATISAAPFTEPVITGPNNNCNDAAHPNIYSVQSVYSSYSWSISPGTAGTISCTTCSSTKIDWAYIPPAGAIITVTVTAGANCTTTVKYQVFPCCTNTEGGPQIVLSNTTILDAYNNIPAFSAVSTFSAGVGTTSTPNNIYINGDLIINVTSWTFLNCPNIFLGPNARILINPAETLKILSTPGGSTILSAGCFYMWDGIYIPDKNTHLIVNAATQYNTIIKDAINAVVSDNGGDFQITNSWLYRDYTGIIVKNYPTFAHTGFIYSSKISCDGLQNLENYYRYTILHSNIAKTDTGIAIHDVKQIAIGDPSFGQNTFDNLQMGIRDSNCTIVTIQNNLFKNINTVWVPNCFNCSPLPVKGRCIWSTGSADYVLQNQLIGGATSAQTNIFKNCTYGILVDKNIKMTITGNQFSDMYYSNPNYDCYAIEVFNLNKYYGLDISNNTFSNFKTGVYVFNITEDGLMTHSVNIYNNIFNSQNGASTGNYGIILQNAVGMYINNSTWVIIKNNTMWNMLNRGIWLTNIPYAYIGDPANINSTNDINFSSTPHYINTAKGILIQHCDNTVINHNNITFPGNPSSASNSYGISVETSGGLISAVTNNSCSNAGTGINFLNATNPNLATCNIVSNYYYGFNLQGSPIGNQPTGLGTSQDNQWNYTTNQVWDINNIGSGYSSWNFKFQAPHYPWTPASNRINPMNSINEIYFANHTSTCTNIPCIGCTIPFTNVINGDPSLSQQQNYVANQCVFSQLKVDSLLLDTNAVFVSYFDSISNENLGKMMNVRYLASADSNLAMATVLNNSVVPSNKYESNSQIVQSIYLDTWAINIYTFDSLQQTALYDIANQNPIDGGIGVYDARVMLGIDLNDTVASTDSGQRKAIHPSIISTNSKFKLYPNPNNGNMQLDYTLDQNQSAQMNIYNLMGKIVNYYELKPGHNIMQINEQSLENGVYFYHIYSNNNVIYSSKLVIIK